MTAVLNIEFASCRDLVEASRSDPNRLLHVRGEVALDERGENP
jgi:hypothetical protein